METRSVLTGIGGALMVTQHYAKHFKVMSGCFYTVVDTPHPTDGNVGGGSTDVGS